MTGKVGDPYHDSKGRFTSGGGTNSKMNTAIRIRTGTNPEPLTPSSMGISHGTYIFGPGDYNTLRQKGYSDREILKFYRRDVTDILSGRSWASASAKKRAFEIFKPDASRAKAGKS